MADVNPIRTVHGQPRGHSFVALDDPATTALAKSGRGFLHALTVTGGTAGTVFLYDNIEASGTVIASIGSTNAVETLTFDVDFQTGLTVSTTAVDTPRVTISYL